MAWIKKKWGEEKIKGFSNRIKKAESINDWAWWGLFVIVVIMGVLFILKIAGRI